MDENFLYTQSVSWLNKLMSAEHKSKIIHQHNYRPDLTEGSVEQNKKVDLRFLMKRMNVERKKEKQSNIILSVAAISSIAVFGIILTL